MNPEWVTALSALATIILAILAWIGRRIWRAYKRGDQFLEDWNGVHGDDAHASRPGVMRRLVQLETTMADIQGQVHLNSGHSMRDEVQRIEHAVETLTDKVAAVQTTVDVLRARP